MKKVAKVVALGLILGHIAVLGGCAKKCGSSEPMMRHKVEKIQKEYGGK